MCKSWNNLREVLGDFTIRCSVSEHCRSGIPELGEIEEKCDAVF